MAVVEVANLYKSYGSYEAVRDVSITIDEGEVYALLGHNGAGKTSVIEILEGHRLPTGGLVRVFGLDPARRTRGFLDRIGIVLQSSSIERSLRVSEAIRFYGASYSRSRSVEEVLDLIGLSDLRNSRVSSLSGGQLRRLDLGLGIVGYPRVVFLDEPTTGFDPMARRKSWGLIKSLCASGTTVLLTTHYLDEAEHLADRIGVMAAGQLVAEGTPAQLIGTSGESRVSFEIPDDLEKSDLALPPGALVEGRRVTIVTSEPTQVLGRLTPGLAARRMELVQLSVTRPSLEDVFIRLVESDGAESPDISGRASRPERDMVEQDDL